MIKAALIFLILGVCGTGLANAAELFEKDVIKTPAGDLEITFIGHGSLMLKFGGKVILQQSDFEVWLDRSSTDPQKMPRIYQPSPAELMQEWTVSTFVNSPAHIGEECIHRIT